MTQSPFSEPELLIFKIFVYILAYAYIAYILASSTGFSILMLSKGDAAETGF